MQYGSRAISIDKVKYSMQKEHKWIFAYMGHEWAMTEWRTYDGGHLKHSFWTEKYIFVSIHFSVIV